MCEYCEENTDDRKQLIMTNGESMIHSDGNEHCIYVSISISQLVGFETFIEINYCPMCGRKV